LLASGEIWTKLEQIAKPPRTTPQAALMTLAQRLERILDHGQRVGVRRPAPIKESKRRSNVWHCGSHR
jgi:hypothetical protein